MNLEVYKYKSVRPAVAAYLKNNPTADLEETCSTLAAATHVPILAICYFVEDINGASPELEGIKQKIKDFYKYDKVILDGSVG